MKREPRLPLPVRDVLDDVLDEPSLQRAYARVRARRAERERSPRGRLVYVIAAAIAVAIAVFLVVRPRAPGPIALDGGAALAVLETDSALLVRLDDGSAISLDPGARIVPLENGGQRVVLLLERGRARFEVKPEGPRRWLVECGAVTVEVVGTGFVVARARSSVRVDVDHGVVLVRGDAVPDHVRRLTAGESIEVATDDGLPSARAPGPASAAIASATVTPPASSSSAAPNASAPPPSAPPWRDLARRGAFADAYELLGADGIRERAASASADELFLLADVARLSGHPGDAMAPLDRILREHAGDSRASLAAFTLGKLYGSDARAAAAMFERAIALGLPSSLQSDARARWVDACRRMNDVACEARASGTAPSPPSPSSSAARSVPER
ncbi:MAG: FecR family protein [Polyangiaceae bacterium]